MKQKSYGKPSSILGEEKRLTTCRQVRSCSPAISPRGRMTRVAKFVALMALFGFCGDVGVAAFVRSLHVGRKSLLDQHTLSLQNGNTADVAYETSVTSRQSRQSRTRMLAPIQRRRAAKSTTSRGSSVASINLGSTTRNSPKTSGKAPLKSSKKNETWNAGSLSLREEMLQHRLLTKEEELELGSKVSRAISLLRSISMLLEERVHVVRKGGRDVPLDIIPDLSKLSGWKDLIKDTRPDQLIFDGSPGSLLSLLTDDDIVVRLGLKGGTEELHEIIQDALDARQTLISCNLKLVLSIAKKWLRRSILSSTSQSSSSASADALLSRMYTNGGWDIPSLDEVVQEGVLGLSRAVDKYDPSRGVRFSTYATHWITSFVRACLTSALTGCLRVPAALHEIKQSYWTIVKNAYLEGEPVPTEEAAAELIGVTPSRLKVALSATKAIISVDAPLVTGMSSKGSSAGGDAAASSSVQLVLSDTLQWLVQPSCGGLFSATISMS